MTLKTRALSAILLLFCAMTALSAARPQQTPRSAAAEVERVLAASGIDQARARFAEIRTKQAGEFAVVEKEFITLGYKLMRGRKLEEAKAVFQMNLEAFPDSWNAWDSLAESHFAIGETDLAEKAYVKSMELNPKNENAKGFLSHIRGGRLNAGRETKIEARFEPGERTGLQGPYLGQKTPGLKPELFAPGIVSTAGHMEFAITFTPDGREIYFTSRPEPDGRNAILVARWEKDGWTAPQEAPFAAGGTWSNEPFITPDGKHLYFGSRRPKPGETEPSYGIWVSDRTGDGWSAPRYHGPGMFVSVDRSGNLYMTDVTNVAGGGIIRYPWSQGAFGKPERLGGTVNDGGETAHACISPDGSFIVFDATRPGGQGGEGDLYVCFKQADGSWGEAFNLGNSVNSDATNFCPSLSPDGKYLFYGMNRDIFWVSTEVIEGLRPPGFPKDSDALSEPGERWSNESLPPGRVMDLLGIRPGLVLGEVGAGRGRVTVHVAARVGENGKVYANDIDAAALDHLKDRCRRAGLTNVETILSLPTDARLPRNRLDMVYMTWVYHHVDQPSPLLKSLLPSLKPWGFVALVEPTPERTEDSRRKLTRELVAREAAAGGFILDAVLEGKLAGNNIFVLHPLVPDSPDSRDRQKVRALWEDYLAYRKTAGTAATLRGYAAALDMNGLPADEIRRRLQVLRSQYTEQPEGIEMIYDPTYGKPLTGDLAKDGFRTAPNTFLVESMKGIEPGGAALDVGAGMGRNGVHLAKLGWDVTGIDLSAEGLAVMRASAEKAGLKVATVKTSYQDFDFGRARWDLVAMILSWAPVEDPAFLARLKDSIRPGGCVVFEHVIQKEADPYAPGVHALQRGQLRELFKDFEILVYRELDLAGDWGGAPVPHVRMLARKRGPAPLGRRSDTGQAPSDSGHPAAGARLAAQGSRRRGLAR
jgi:2-polyprenyl-3-methyl-5-hydroxy-6-metoxy-1,4-benzoquinol methylase